MKDNKEKKVKFNSTEKFVMAVAEGNREEAKKLLKRALEEKVSEKIRQTIKEEDK